VNKLELAHAFALHGIDVGVLNSNYSLDLLVAHSWQYADLMLAEDEKRKDKSLPEVLNDDFVIDWDYVSKRYNYWVMDKDGKFSGMSESRAEMIWNFTKTVICV
jgi:hypothetical protein